MESRIEDLTSQLNQSQKEKSDTSRLQRSADKVARDAKFQLAESDRQKAKLEEERKAYEAQLRNLRQALDAKVPFDPFSSPPSVQLILCPICLANRGKQSSISEATRGARSRRL